MNQLKPLFWKKSNLFSKLLFPLSLLYKFFLFLSRSRTIEEKFDIPIICVGNIYLGGTGKTPLALKIYNELLKKNLKPGIIKKFYKEHLDEQNLIRSKNVKLFLNKSRKNSIIEAINKKINVVIMDDGFQDFSIKKNLHIICFNSEQLVGNGLLLPAGPLRENLNSVIRAQIVVINGEKNYEFEKRILKLNNSIKIFYSEYVPTNIEYFKNKKFLAFAGIGEPDNFFKLLRKKNINVVKSIKFPDHFDFSNENMREIKSIASENNLEMITTEKDFFRLKKSFCDDINFLKLRLDIKNKNEFIKIILKYCL